MVLGSLNMTLEKASFQQWSEKMFKKIKFKKKREKKTLGLAKIERLLISGKIISSCSFEDNGFLLVLRVFVAFFFTFFGDFFFYH